MGMLLDVWTYKSCICQVGTGEDWATIYFITSEEKNKGHATTVLKYLKDYYANEGKAFGCSFALNPVMTHLLNKLNIKEYKK